MIGVYQFSRRVVVLHAILMVLCELGRSNISTKGFTKGKRGVIYYLFSIICIGKVIATGVHVVLNPSTSTPMLIVVASTPSILKIIVATTSLWMATTTNTATMILYGCFID